MSPIFRASSHDQFVGTGRHSAFVRAVDVKGLTIWRGPECPVIHGEHADVIGVPLQHQRLIGGQRRPSARMVHAHTGRNGGTCLRILDNEPYGAERCGLLRGAAPGDLDVTDRQACLASDRDVAAMSTLAREPRAIQRQCHGSKRGARLGRDGSGGPQTGPAVLVPPHHERCRELGSVGHRERHGLVDVERVRIVDVNSQHVADEAGLVLNHTHLERVSRARHSERRGVDAEEVGEVVLLPLHQFYIPCLGSVSSQRANRSRHHEQPDDNSESPSRPHRSGSESHTVVSPAPIFPSLTVPTSRWRRLCPTHTFGVLENRRGRTMDISMLKHFLARGAQD